MIFRFGTRNKKETTEPLHSISITIFDRLTIKFEINSSKQSVETYPTCVENDETWLDLFLPVNMRVTFRNLKYTLQSDGDVLREVP